MADIPAWVQTLLQNQQQQITQLTALMQNIPQITQSPPSVPALAQQNLRLKDIYKFQPLDKSDDMGY